MGVSESARTRACRRCLACPSRRWCGPTPSAPFHPSAASAAWAACPLLPLAGTTLPPAVDRHSPRHWHRSANIMKSSTTPSSSRTLVRSTTSACRSRTQSDRASSTSPPAWSCRSAWAPAVTGVSPAMPRRPDLSRSWWWSTSTVGWDQTGRQNSPPRTSGTQTWSATSPAAVAAANEPLRAAPALRCCKTVAASARTQARRPSARRRVYGMQSSAAAAVERRAAPPAPISIQTAAAAFGRLPLRGGSGADARDAWFSGASEPPPFPSYDTDGSLETRTKRLFIRFSFPSFTFFFSTISETLIDIEIDDYMTCMYLMYLLVSSLLSIPSKIISVSSMISDR